MNSIFDIFSIHTILWHFNIGSGYDMSYIEAIGTVFGLINIWFASKEKYSNFYFGLINVALFGIIFYQIQLYGNLLLQIFFFAMNIYGLFSWRHHTNKTEDLHIHWLSRKSQIAWLIIAILSIGILSSYINEVFHLLTHLGTEVLKIFSPTITMPDIEHDQHPIADSSIMVLSIIAMILMTRKAVENWLIWCFINVLSIYLYAIQGVYLMSIEYVIILFIAIKGSVDWIRQANNTRN